MSILLNLIRTKHFFREKLQRDFLQLVSRRHHTSTAAWNWNQQVVINPHFLVLEDLLKLQEDVVSLYLSGRPKIKNIASLHIPYAFQAPKPAPEADPLKYILCSQYFSLMFYWCLMHIIHSNCSLSTALNKI